MRAAVTLREARTSRANQIVIVQCVDDGDAVFGGDLPDRGRQSRQIVGVQDVGLEGADTFGDQRRCALPILDRMPDAANGHVPLFRKWVIHIPHRRGMDVDAVALLYWLIGSGGGPDYFDAVAVFLEAFRESAGEYFRASDQLGRLRRRV